MSVFMQVLTVTSVIYVFLFIGFIYSVERGFKKQKIHYWLIKTFGLKGSWKWAKKQMAKGEIVRCKHWSGALKLRTSPEMVLSFCGENPKRSTLLQCNFTTTKKHPINGKPLWETSNHHLSYEDFTDYEIFKWKS